MRVQCDVCEASLASVMCCADEAALCTQCDLKVHAANKLANKHQRVNLYPPGEDHPVCDICQEKSAFFFCQEDRALLCRDCDVSIHSVNPLSEKHRRFLVTGTRVSLETADYGNGDDANDACQAVPTAQEENQTQAGKSSHLSQLKSMVGSRKSSSHAGGSSSMAYASTSQYRDPNIQYQDSNLYRANGDGYDNRDGFFDLNSDPATGWRVDELLNIPDLADGYSLADVGSSKAEVEANLGDFDWTADLSLFDEQVYAESLHEVPSLPETTPGRIPGSSRSKNQKHDNSAVVPDFDDSFVVPDLGLGDSSSTPAKRRRNLS